MKKTTFTIISILGSCVVSTQTLAASFDCNKASTWVEKTICTSPELSKLDENLASKYKNALTNDPEIKEYTRQQQRTWLKFQRNTCKEEECLIREYKEQFDDALSYGISWDYSSELSRSDLPNKQAFGTFSENVEILIYTPSTDSWDNTGLSENTISIHSVSDKPHLSIIEGDLIFTNAHTCYIKESKAIWSQNHWVLNDYDDGDSSELRLYPMTYKGKNKLLLRDVDNRYKYLHCGMRGYFDGKILESK